MGEGSDTKSAVKNEMLSGTEQKRAHILFDFDLRTGHDKK
jgi:hypothetical protein